jgi:hypothetical protein
MSPLDKHSSNRARGIPARPFTGTALDVTLRACDRNVPDPVHRLARTACTVPCTAYRLTWYQVRGEYSEYEYEYSPT